MTEQPITFPSFNLSRFERAAWAEAVRLENHIGCEQGHHFYAKEHGFKQKCPKCKRWF